MTTYIKDVTSLKHSGGYALLNFSSVKNMSESKLLQLLAMSHDDLVGWIETTENRVLLANIIMWTLDKRGSFTAYLKDVVDSLPYLQNAAKVLNNPQTNWKSVNQIDYIRPIYLLFACLESSGEFGYEKEKKMPYSCMFEWYLLYDSAKTFGFPIPAVNSLL